MLFVPKFYVGLFSIDSSLKIIIILCHFPSYCDFQDLHTRMRIGMDNEKKICIIKMKELLLQVLLRAHTLLRWHQCFGHPSIRVFIWYYLLLPPSRSQSVIFVSAKKKITVFTILVKTINEVPFHLNQHILKCGVLVIFLFVLLYYFYR